MTRRATINGRVLLLRDMRGYPSGTDVLHTVLGVVAVVTTQRPGPVAPFPDARLGTPVPHLARPCRGLATVKSISRLWPRNACFEQQARFRIRGAGVGFVAPVLSTEVQRRVVRIVVRRRRTLLSRLYGTETRPAQGTCG